MESPPAPARRPPAPRAPRPAGPALRTPAPRAPSPGAPAPPAAAKLQAEWRRVSSAVRDLQTRALNRARTTAQKRGAGPGADYVDDDLPDYTETVEQATARLTKRPDQIKTGVWLALEGAGTEGMKIPDIVAVMFKRNLYSKLGELKNTAHSVGSVLTA